MEDLARPSAPASGRLSSRLAGTRGAPAALQAVRDGDFSVRLPGDRVGLAGKIADTFNEIVAANERMAEELERVGQVVGKEGKIAPARRASAAAAAPGARWSRSVNTLIDDLLWPTTEVTGAIAAVAKGDLSQTDAPRRRRPAARGRVPALGDDRQHDDRAAARVHLRGDARRARGRHRRQARRPGAGARRVAASGRTSPRASTRWPAT